MENRFLGTNLRKLVDILKFVERENIEALYISIDFEKCFDTIEIDAIVGALRLLNFGEYLIKMVQVLYAEFEMCIYNNGTTSNWFKPTRGTRQGAPESGCLFLLVAEVFLIQLLSHKELTLMTTSLNDFHSLLTIQVSSHFMM